MASLEEKIHKKIVDLNTLKPIIEEWKNQNYKIVFTNGCFDILHFGHIDYLSKASNLGSKLIIGLNSDASVRNIKGKTRPIQDQKSRSAILASLFFVDLVVLFDEDTPINLISEIIPNVLVKGSDYEISEIVGHKIVLENGGSVETIEFVENYSTSAIENKIIKMHLKGKPG